MENLKLPLRYAFYAALTGIIGLYLTTFTEPRSLAASAVGIVTKMIIVFLIYYGITDYFRKTGTEINFGTIFKTGMYITLMAAFIYGAFVFVFYEYFAGEYKEILINESIKRMQERGQLSGEQLQRSIETTRNFFSYFAFVGAVLDMLIVGTVTSILTALWRKEK